jgi:hypothetical protein
MIRTAPPEAPETPFTWIELAAAADAWGATSGHAALAASLDWPLERVRPHLPGGEVDDAEMFWCLGSLGIRLFDCNGPGGNGWPNDGIVRLEFENGYGPRSTWLAVRHQKQSLRVWVFDPFDSHFGWTSWAAWTGKMYPWLTWEKRESWDLVCPRRRVR